MDAMDALTVAIQREKEAHKCYSEAATRTTNEAGKKMFTWLAAEEKGHIDILQNQLDHVKGQGKWLSEEGWCSYGDINNPIDCAEFGSSTEVKCDISGDLSELDILQSAISDEKEATEYYDKLAHNTSDPNGKAMLEKLSLIEKGHLDLLKEEYDYLSKAKSLFTLHRFSLHQNS